MKKTHAQKNNQTMRKPEEVRAEYVNTAFRIGERQFQIYEMEQEVALLKRRCVDLKLEYEGALKAYPAPETGPQEGGPAQDTPPQAPAPEQAPQA